MDCFHDFCLACDRESTDGPYCSQACRLADLEKASQSNPPSPTSFFHSNGAASSSSVTGLYSGFVLAPAYKFPQRAIHSQVTGGIAKGSETRTEDMSFSKSLTPSSSRSSLSSNSNRTSGCGVSEEAKLELEEYFRSFDQTRAARRRSSLR